MMEWFKYQNAGIYFMRYPFYDSHVGDTFTNELQPYYTAIYNAQSANINITNLYVGIGAHFSLLHNRGSASIRQLHTEFSQNGSAYYNRWNLRLYTLMTNNFGTLHITDSNIVGADTSLIDIYGGTVELNNVILAQSMMGITTYYSAESISMDNVNLYEIGKFYASFGAASYHSKLGGYASTGEWNWFATTPCHLAADSVTIRNSKFSYLDSFGVVTVNEYGLYDVARDNTVIKSLEFVDNKIILKSIGADKSRTDFTALKSLLNESFGQSVDTDLVLLFIDNALKTMNDSTGLIVVENGYGFVIGNNEILVGAELRVNDSGYAVNPYLYIDSGSADGCMAGNVLENIDIVVKSGNIKSCKHYGFDANQVQ